ncbi:MAG: hypothetical protein IJS99_08825 [Synergistaceae bacterium]|nr:hypothetical protein [Synergistaceae bacterium]
MKNYNFSGQAAITRSMLAWWAINYKDQALPKLSKDLNIEHLRKKGKIVNPGTYTMLGNQSLLEGKLQTSGAPFDFPYKNKKYYSRSQIQELKELSENNTNFDVKEIHQRTKKISESFIEFVLKNDLMNY